MLPMNGLFVNKDWYAPSSLDMLAMSLLSGRFCGGRRGGNGRRKKERYLRWCFEFLMDVEACVTKALINRASTDAHSFVSRRLCAFVLTDTNEIMSSFALSASLECWIKTEEIYLQESWSTSKAEEAPDFSGKFSANTRHTASGYVHRISMTLTWDYVMLVHVMACYLETLSLGLLIRAQNTARLRSRISMTIDRLHSLRG